MGLLSFCVIWLIPFASTYFFVAKTWWFPAGFSTSTAAIDHQFAVTFVLMGIIFVAAQLTLGFFAWRYRSDASANRADYSHGDIRLELMWTTLTAILFIGLNLMAVRVVRSEE